MSCEVSFPVKVSGLKDLDAWSSTTTNEVGCLWVAGVLWVPLGSAAMVG